MGNGLVTSGEGRPMEKECFILVMGVKQSRVSGEMESCFTDVELVNDICDLQSQ